MNNATISTQHVLTSSFVKYNRLRELVNYMFTGSKATQLNIYIDLYGAIKTLFSDSFRTDISDYTAFTSTIINMCGHYRSFFKGIGVQTKIFIIFSLNVCEINRKLIPEYNNKFFNKTSNKVIYEMVDMNNVLLETLCPFLPDIFFIKTEFESSVLIDYLITTGDKNPNLIISKDLYPAQLTEIHPDTAYIKPKKIMGNDISSCISPREKEYHIDDFKNAYCAARGAVPAIDNATITISPNNFNLLSALSRFPERGLPSIYNIKTANKIIYNIVGESAVNISADTVNKFNPLAVPVSLIDNRHKALDVEAMRATFLDSIEPKVIHLDNFEDSASVNMICAEYFKDNPIDLGRL